MTNHWNAVEYDAKHAFVYEKAKGLVALLAPEAGERILDLGCGTGALTAEIAERGAEILGVDRSEEMISQARKKLPALKFEVLEVRELRFNREFNAVFSNAVLHWIPPSGLLWPAHSGRNIPQAWQRVTQCSRVCMRVTRK